MVISYKKLWKLLIDRDMKKKDLIAKSGISQSSVTKLGHNESVSTDIIVKICTALECDLTDIMELVPEESVTDCVIRFNFRYKMRRRGERSFYCPQSRSFLQRA